ncbi:MAG: bacillithiol biosynthesis cysteine-adding enzyme BshC [Candidatus Zixiibacteriota bacterium]
MQKLVEPSKELGYSQLYIDFLADKPSARKFFLSRGIPSTVEEIDRHSYPRAEMIQILQRQNKLFGSSPAAMAAIEKLADPRAICVVTGQQAGLYAQCTLVQLKAFAVAKKAALLEKELNRPVVPIFWIAGDDHDVAEVSQVGVLNQAGQLNIFKYNANQDVDLPVGMVKLSNEVSLKEVYDQYRAAVGESEFTADLYRIIESSYTPGDTFVTAFGKMMAALTASYSTVYFSPTDPAVSKLAAPFFRKLIEDNDAVRKNIQATNEQILQAGYSLQVEKSEAATHLFHTGSTGRKPITTGTHGSFNVSGESWSSAQLRSLVETAPEQLTPDVLLRPVMQSYLFPVVIQYGGPAEIVYLAQLNPLFSQFGLPTPTHLSRPTVTLIEKKFEKVLSEYDIAYIELAGDIEQLVNRVMGKSFPTDLESRFTTVRADIGRNFDQLTRDSLAFDPSLVEFARQTSGKIDFAVKALEEKVFSSHKKKSKETREKIYRLEIALHPRRGLQDRTINIGNYIAKYGFGVISFMYDRMDINQTSLQLLYLSELND